ncbi:hypothetical protein PR048_023454 [Dryococelus australis]|uniref:Uncharacterized protein n=1 Tax=Dryococelus australis TaxID=614101 RepID=A0ABQ9GU76_9NEOP|nr:hypothetical protein PR048_023454 [Dryococelus australis]
MAPKEVTDNSLMNTVYNNVKVINERKTKFKVGKFIRISKQKGIFEKKCTEILKIILTRQTHPRVYYLDTCDGEPIQMGFKSMNCKNSVLQMNIWGSCDELRGGGSGVSGLHGLRSKDQPSSKQKTKGDCVALNRNCLLGQKPKCIGGKGSGCGLERSMLFSWVGTMLVSRQPSPCIDATLDISSPNFTGHCVREERRAFMKRCKRKLSPELVLLAELSPLLFPQTTRYKPPLLSLSPDFNAARLKSCALTRRTAAILKLIFHFAGTTKPAATFRHALLPPRLLPFLFVAASFTGSSIDNQHVMLSIPLVVSVGTDSTDDYDETVNVNDGTIDLRGEIEPMTTEAALMKMNMKTDGAEDDGDLLDALTLPSTHLLQTREMEKAGDTEVGGKSGGELVAHVNVDDEGVGARYGEYIYKEGSRAPRGVMAAWTSSYQDKAVFCHLNENPTLSVVDEGEGWMYGGVDIVGAGWMSGERAMTADPSWSWPGASNPLAPLVTASQCLATAPAVVPLVAGCGFTVAHGDVSSKADTSVEYLVNVVLAATVVCSMPVLLVQPPGSTTAALPSSHSGRQQSRTGAAIHAKNCCASPEMAALAVTSTIFSLTAFVSSAMTRIGSSSADAGLLPCCCRNPCHSLLRTQNLANSLVALSVLSPRIYLRLLYVGRQLSRGRRRGRDASHVSLLSIMPGFPRRRGGPTRPRAHQPGIGEGRGGSTRTTHNGSSPPVPAAVRDNILPQLCLTLLQLQGKELLLQTSGGYRPARGSSWGQKPARRVRRRQDINQRPTSQEGPREGCSGERRYVEETQSSATIVKKAEKLKAENHLAVYNRQPPPAPTNNTVLYCSEYSTLKCTIVCAEVHSRIKDAATRCGLIFGAEAPHSTNTSIPPPSLTFPLVHKAASRRDAHGEPRLCKAITTPRCRSTLRCFANMCFMHDHLVQPTALQGHHGIKPVRREKHCDRGTMLTHCIWSAEQSVVNFIPKRGIRTPGIATNCRQQTLWQLLQTSGRYRPARGSSWGETLARHVRCHQDISQRPTSQEGPREGCTADRHCRYVEETQPSATRIKGIHGDLSPFLLQPFHELSNGFWPRLTSPHSAIQFVPKMFYRVEVGALDGPVQSANIVVEYCRVRSCKRERDADIGGRQQIARAARREVTMSHGRWAHNGRGVKNYEGGGSREGDQVAPASLITKRATYVTPALVIVTRGEGFDIDHRCGTPHTRCSDRTAQTLPLCITVRGKRAYLAPNTYVYYKFTREEEWGEGDAFTCTLTRVVSSMSLRRLTYSNGCTHWFWNQASASLHIAGVHGPVYGMRGSGIESRPFPNRCLTSRELQIVVSSSLSPGKCNSDVSQKGREPPKRCGLLSPLTHTYTHSQATPQPLLGPAICVISTRARALPRAAT